MIDNNFNPFAVIDSRLLSIEQSLAALAAKETPQAEKKYYSISEAAAKTNTAEITFYRGVKKGTIPGKRIGSRIMIPGSFVDK